MTDTELTCTESECRTPATWKYMLQHDQPRACCTRHEGQVRQRLEALGRMGPLVQNPVELVLCAAPEPPPRNLAVELGEALSEVSECRRALIQCSHELREAQGQVGVLDRQVQQLLRDKQGLVDECDRLRRELNITLETQLTDVQAGRA
jgi:hypothetical protein